MSAPSAATSRSHLNMIEILVIGLGVACDPGTPANPGSGKLTPITPTVTSFSGVSVALNAGVTTRRGDTPALTVFVDDNLAPHIDSVVEGGKLQFDADTNISPSQTIQTLITTPSLASFNLAGSGNVQIDDLSGPEASITIAGGGRVTSGITADSLELSLAGAGNVLVHGKSPKAAESVPGSGTVQASHLSADDVDVTIAGGGSFDVHGSARLNVSITGSGTVSCSGSRRITRSILGSGSVIRSAGDTPPSETIGDIMPPSVTTPQDASTNPVESPPKPGTNAGDDSEDAQPKGM